MVHGQRRDLGLGSFPLVSLREARERAFANRKTAREGGDPLNGRRNHVNVPTFAEAAKRVWNDNRPGWRHSGHAQEWMSSLARHVLPYIGGRPVSSVSSAEILDTLRRIWHSRPETARRVRQRVSAVMDWAVAMEYRGDNPCGRLGPVLGQQQSVVEHMRAVPHGEVGGRSARCGVRVRRHPSSWRSSFSCSRPRGRERCAAQGGTRLIFVPACGPFRPGG